jgi:hypothetical protein
MIFGKLFGKTGQALAVAAAILAAIGLTTVPRSAVAGGGWGGGGSALVPPLGSGLELSRSARCSQTPTIVHITTRTATTRPSQLTTHRRRIIPPREAVGVLITDTITLVE